ncbi:hypothetical protein MRX96_030196 [Rhipicephalus microplus]
MVRGCRWPVSAVHRGWSRQLQPAGKSRLRKAVWPLIIFICGLIAFAAITAAFNFCGYKYVRPLKDVVARVSVFFPRGAKASTAAPLRRHSTVIVFVEG